MTISPAQTDAYYARITDDPPEASCWRCETPTDPATLAWWATRHPSAAGVIVGLIASFIAAALFLGLLLVGQAVLCKAHHDEIRYCAGYSEQVRP